MSEAAVDMPPRKSELADPVLIRARGITRRFGPGLPALDAVTLDIRQGEILGLVGESGSGKSTLGRILLGLIAASEGSVTFDDMPMPPLRPTEAQIVFQDALGALNPRRTIGQSIALPLVNAGWSRERRADRISELLQSVGLSPSDAARYPHQFSGGQCQRIVIARALALGPRFLFLDEPVSALDVSVQAQILNLLARVQAEAGLTFLFVSHDLEVVRHFCDRTAVLYRGQLMETGPADELYDAPRHPYTRALRASVLNGGGLPELVPETPGSDAAPGGCRFAARCPKVRPICLIERPPERPVGPDHTTACHALTD
ncbi:ABC di/oligopeptide transporter ATPase [Primorskyibacter flagellatus]|uniref:ABC di/oligopeptide transporter ATPase n=1 Tax=Primorskyibacter flagellatus TaxID=1387277 RepID=A0A917EAP3_9RHOB|nr:ABC transporter ATP-binding protein [Primorskyibacter flagellatus]GGE15553.1 ABC di/oligopeptide transporter ATPase [Primorskyibacter flagellatus]